MKDPHVPGWTYSAVVDPVYLPDVLALVRTRLGEVQTLRAGGYWQPLENVSQAVESEYPLVMRELTADETLDIIGQINDAGPPPASEAAAARIAADLRAIHGTGASRSVSLGGAAYVQWASLEDGSGLLTVELPGNAVLPVNHQLSPADEAELARYAAIPPHADNPNWSWLLTAEGFDPDVAARFALGCLENAYHVDLMAACSAIFAQVPLHPAE